MKLTKGEICINGKFRYFPEIPYIKFGTAKENIIFGASSSLDNLKYFDVLDKTKLIDVLCDPPDNDNIPIGYLQLGLDQLQKINLAQALYCDDRYVTYIYLR